MNIKPLLDKVVVKEIKEKEKETACGILLPSSAQEKPCYAEVVAVGNGGIVDGNKVEMLVKKGDKVLFSKFAGNDFKLENETYIILKQDDILAIVE